MKVATPEDVFFQHAKNGDSKDMNVDGSTTAVHFDVLPSSGPLYIQRCNILIIDNNQTPTKFGGLSALDEGVMVRVIEADGTVLKDFLDGETIKKNADWVKLAGTDDPIRSPTSGDDEFAVRWTLTKGLGAPLYLCTGRLLRYTIQDDLSNLTQFEIMAQGTTG